MNDDTSKETRPVSVALRLMSGAVAVLMLCLLTGAGGARGAETECVPGQIPDDHTTLQCIGIRWFVRGDSNANGSVAVRYRKTGETHWKDAMPLFRVEIEAIAEKRRPPAGTGLFAGSIFGLKPDTDYEVELDLKDPDGGGTKRVIKRRTWAEPVAPAPKRTLYVTPGTGGGDGSRQNPFKGIAASNAVAKPGDMFLLTAGTYQNSGDPKKHIRFSVSGTAEAPVVWRGEGEVFINGGIDARKIKHVFFENLKIRKARHLCMSLGNSSFITIRRCSFIKASSGIKAGGAERLFIADNTFQGQVLWHNKVGHWETRCINISGTGHVICHNRIYEFKDGIDTFNKWPTRDIDIYGNEISGCVDDGIELDFSEHNVRAFHNRLTNCGCGVSFQSSYGGPNYVIRNVFANIRATNFKLKLTPTNKRYHAKLGTKDKDAWKFGPYRTSGGVILHNTAVRRGVALQVWSSEGPVHHFTMLNNLLVGTPARNIWDFCPPVRYSRFDYNAYVAQDVKLMAFLDGKKYRTFEDFQKGTGYEEHGLFFDSPAGIFVDGFKLPQDVKTLYPVSGHKPFLRQDSPVIDKGTRIPNVNDAFRGKAPDLGAIELGDQMPPYGPREAK